MHLLNRIVRRCQRTLSTLAWTAEDQQKLEFYSQFIGRGDLCFDVGANLGNRTKIFLKLRARVIAVEPQAKCAQFLRIRYAARPGLTVIRKALADREGTAEMFIGSTHTLSTLESGWIEATTRSGRFSQYRWNKRRVVRVTTLDRLIERYGIPAFVKIDVEGSEYRVLRGLSRPVGALSLEFAPEFVESIMRCIQHLETLGRMELNYTLGESMVLALAEWVTPREMSGILAQFGEDADFGLFGDVYIRFLGP